MPKSKRDKRVALTQTQKKGLELKQKLIEEVRKALDKYTRLFTFSVHNMRNVKLKNLRQEWKDSRFFFGKNKVLALALGQVPENEYKDNLHQLSKRLKGQTGLLLTNKSKQEVLDFFDSYSAPDFARSGTEATQTVVIDKGPLKSFIHSMQPQLKLLGMPVELQKGIVTLREDHQACTVGVPLTPEQARILKLFQYQMAEFTVAIESMWETDGTFEMFENRRPEKLKSSKVFIKAPDALAEEGDALLVTDKDSDSDNMISDFEDET